MDPTVVADAVQSIKAAELLSSNCTEKERDLIAAMAKRYPAKTADDRSEFNADYSNAFAALNKKFPEDHDIAVMYAESMMNLHPWDLWDKQGNAKEWTNDILAILRGILDEDPQHAIANHFYIHATEASHKPSMGNDAAKRLEGIAPGAGHLVHMPSHIYIRTGNYKDCTRVNIDAVNVDSVYTTACHAAGAYPLAYYPHNFHFLCACAALEGNGTLAYDASLRMQEKLDTDVMREPGWGTIQHYYTIPYYIMVKFEMWDEIIATNMPEADLIYPSAIMTYARGMAFADQGKIAKAKQELTKLRELATNEGIKEINIWEINDASDLTEIAELVLEAEILANSDDLNSAVPLLINAITLEDKLNYNEPPDWFFSVRHYLGDIYLQLGSLKDAEATYRKDLFNYPENGWALSGLHKALIEQGRESEAAEVRLRFDESWVRADRKLRGSRIL
jgi:tetratricopeptide (TPR) repeat protein